MIPPSIKNEQTLSRLLTQIPEPVFLVQMDDLCLIDANPSFLDFFNLEKNTVKGLSLNKLLSPSSLDQLKKWSPATSGEEFETNLFLKSSHNQALPTSFLWEKPWAPHSALGVIQGFHPLQETHQALKEENSKLEEMVEEKTRELLNTNETLRQTLAHLRGSQGHLVESKKMEALTSLVAGVAHEINTPLGSGLTAMSFLSERAEDFRNKINSGPLEKDDWVEFFDEFEEVEGLVTRSFKRITQLVRRFKEVSVDQMDEDKTTFPLSEFMADLEISLKQELKKKGHKLVLSFPQDLELTTYSQSLTQILSQMVLNSLHHGYQKGESGTSHINFVTEADHLSVFYSDDGIGLSHEGQKKIFEPFYTTNRLIGGAGLGMHIVYNLVTHRLGGQIHYTGNIDRGVAFKITFPRQLIKSDASSS
jgi:signal transduction histidine kinase